MEDGIIAAFDRIDAFLAVQGRRPRLDAVVNLQAAVGIEDDERCVIRDRVAALGYAEHGGAILLGMLLGLFAGGTGGSTPVLRPEDVTR